MAVFAYLGVLPRKILVVEGLHFSLMLHILQLAAQLLGLCVITQGDDHEYIGEYVHQKRDVCERIRVRFPDRRLRGGNVVISGNAYSLTQREYDEQAHCLDGIAADPFPPQVQYREVVHR